MTDYKNAIEYGKAVKRKLARAVKSTEVITEISDYYKEESKKRRFAPISRSWAKRRHELKSKNPTDGAYSYGRSNLTFTGQLINSIKSRWNSKNNQIEIYPSGMHKGYVGKNGKRGKSVRNSDIAFGQEIMQRFLFIPTRKMQKEIINIWQKAITKALRSNK